MNFNNIGSVDFSTNKQFFEDYIYSLDNFKDIQNKLGGGTIDLLTNIVAGYTSYMTYKNKMLREETYLQKSKLESSVFEAAFPLGYRFQRSKSPIIKFKYISSEDTILETGKILGSVVANDKKYSLIYFGLTTKLKNNDFVELVVGEYNEIEYDTQTQNVVELLIEPQTLECIDNDNIIVYNNGMNQTVGTSFESYIMNQTIVNWSKSTYDSLLYVYDKENNLGISDAGNLTIKYIETDGYVDYIDPKSIKITDKYFFYEISYNGQNKDSLQKIRKLAPALRAAKGRTVTINDYTMYLNNSNIFSDVLVERQKNIPATWQIIREDDLISGESISIYIEGSIIYGVGETVDELYQDLYNKLLLHKLVNPKIITLADNSLELYIEQIFVDREIIVKSEDLNIKVINDFTISPSCSLNIFYVKSNGDDPNVPGGRLPMNNTELMYIDKFMKDYGMVGTRLMYIPAVAKPAYIAMEIKLVDEKFQDLVYEFIKDTIKNYEYKLSTVFESSYIISDIVKFEVNDNGILVRPIQYAKVLNEDVDSKDYEYLTFFGIDISFTGE
jgi:hypothetical protein